MGLACSAVADGRQVLVSCDLRLSASTASGWQKTGLVDLLSLPMKLRTPFIWTNVQGLRAARRRKT